MIRIKAIIHESKLIRYSLIILFGVFGVLMFGRDVGMYVTVASLVVSYIPVWYIGYMTEETELEIKIKKGKDE